MGKTTIAGTIEGTIGFENRVSAKLAGEYSNQWEKNVELSKMKDISYIEFTASLERFANLLKTYKELKIVIFIDEAQVIFSDL